MAITEANEGNEEEDLGTRVGDPEAPFGEQMRISHFLRSKLACSLFSSFPFVCFLNRSG